MLTDGLHNLSDVLQLIVAYIALKKSSAGPTEQFSYGWKRTEIVGALMNACFLISLCIYIFVEAIQKFISPPTGLFSTDPEGIIFIAIAGAGIVVNGLGSIIFAVLGGHGHSHGGHGHSHGGHGGHGGKPPGKKSIIEEQSLLAEETPPTGGSVYIKKREGKDLNMSAVFLHYLGDCVASGILLAIGLIAYFLKGNWTLYLDPIGSILIAIMLLWSSVPLTKECCYMLLQQVPKNIPMFELRKNLAVIMHLQGYHDLHIWQLADDITIGTVHACVYDSDTTHIETIKEEIKKVFHNYEIHSTTVQVEVLSAENEDEPYICKHNCQSTCTEEWCCKGNNIGNSIIPPKENVEMLSDA